MSAIETKIREAIWPAAVTLALLAGLAFVYLAGVKVGETQHPRLPLPLILRHAKCPKCHRWFTLPPNQDAPPTGDFAEPRIGTTVA